MQFVVTVYRTLLQSSELSVQDEVPPPTLIIMLALLVLVLILV